MVRFMQTLGNTKKIPLIIGISLLITVTACTPSKIKDRIDETDQLNQSVEKEVDVEDLEPSEVEISEKQKEVLDELDTNVEDALKKIELEERTEIELDISLEKDKYDDPEELGQYLSHLFYFYHTKEMDSTTFYKKIHPHFHEDFKELLPADEIDQLEAFEILQTKFDEGLPSPIDHYKITEAIIDVRTEEASLYRVYELENTEKLYFLMLLEKVGNQWLLKDDSPAPAYSAVGKTYKDSE